MGIIQKIKSTFFALKVFKNYLEKCRRRDVAKRKSNKMEKLAKYYCIFLTLLFIFNTCYCLFVISGPVVFAGSTVPWKPVSIPA